MDRRFLAYYETELEHLRGLAGEFAKAHPRVAGRLGLDSTPCADPYVERLLEGFAFLSARVQLKLDAEFPHFTEHLLELVYPGYLAPTPAIALVQLEPDVRVGGLQDGYLVPRGTRLSSQLTPKLPTRCTFVTAHDVTLWPVTIVDVKYFAGAALGPAGVPRRPGVESALQIRLRALGERPFQAISLDRLVLHLHAGSPRAFRLHELLMGHALAIVCRPGVPTPAWENLLTIDHLRQVGMSPGEALFPCPREGFDGYRLLREYFAFPHRLLFVEIAGLGAAVRRCEADVLDLLIVFGQREPALENAVSPSDLALFVTPAVNLFDRPCEPIVLDRRQREQLVVADRLRPLDYEVYSVVDVVAGGGDGNGQPFVPFYGLDTTRQAAAGAYYTLERRPCVFTSRDPIRAKSALSYQGSEVFISLVDGQSAPWRSDLKRLHVRALCTNRDLPLLIVRAPGEGQFTVEIGAPIVAIKLLGEPTPPRASLAWGEPSRTRPEQTHGEAAWRLISHLALSCLSLVDHGADPVREMLRLYADFAEPDVARQVEGVARVTSQLVTDRLPMSGPIAFGRGLEIDLTIDERLFDGGGFLFGAVLEQFFRRYVSVNSFTRTVIRSTERGEIMRWPARIGRRGLI